tara:strand:+ start:1012 stop:2181 length:1170 start_codon:yes stop_codon:yes gene_type:complete
VNYFEKSLIVHEQLRGKISINSKIPIGSRDDLSIAYTPGVAAPCEEIASDPESAYKLTIKGNSVAVVTDGSAVLGLGDIGPLAALPVMEGKALLFKEFAKIDAWPICIDTKSTEKIIETCRLLSPSFGGINLEDISAPRCFEIETALQDLGIPVFHDDQHGTAIVLMAALINAAKVVEKSLNSLRIVINGAGAAGTAIARFVSRTGFESHSDQAVDDVIVCDSKGIISKDRGDLNSVKKKLLSYSNKEDRKGSLSDALVGADVFIGVSKGNVVTPEDIRRMAKDPIIFAMANPTPEIMPEEALGAGAKVIGTGRSDFPNQVNNVLVFPGIFRGALDGRAKTINNKMKIAASEALAACVNAPTPAQILPHPLDRTVAPAIAKMVRAASRD